LSSTTIIIEPKKMDRIFGRRNLNDWRAYWCRSTDAHNPRNEKDPDQILEKWVNFTKAFSANLRS
jgi:hypothetical protein